MKTKNVYKYMAKKSKKGGVTVETAVKRHYMSLKSVSAVSLVSPEATEESESLTMTSILLTHSQSADALGLAAPFPPFNGQNPHHRQHRRRRDKK